MLLRRFLVLPLAALLTACNVYHPLKDGVGYVEVPMGQDSYQVTYVGDSTQSVAEARQFCLIRASELAVLRNAPFFQILNERIYLAYGQHYWPGSDTRYVETFSDSRGRVRAVVHHVYDPGYTEVYMTPEVTMQVRVSAGSGANTIPAAYLLRRALENKVQLSPGVAERVPSLPETSEPVVIPSPPQPATKPRGY